MDELIRVQTQTIGSQEVNAVDARELHYFLESKQAFSDWIKSRLTKYRFIEGKDYLINRRKMDEKCVGNVSFDYYLTIDTAKEIAMVENNEKGREARQYFIEVEKRYQAGVTKELSIHEQTLNVIRYHINLTKELEAKVKEDAPKVELFNRAMATETTFDITTAAKLLGLKPNKLFKDLRDKGVLYHRDGNNIPSEYYMNMKYFEPKETVINVGEKEITRVQPRLTQKGFDWLSKLYPANNQLNLL